MKEAKKVEDRNLRRNLGRNIQWKKDEIGHREKEKGIKKRRKGMFSFGGEMKKNEGRENTIIQKGKEAKEQWNE